MNINLTLLGQAIAMAVFVWFCMKYVWPPLVQIIEERQQQIADGLAAADKGARSFDEAQVRIATLVEEARGQARTIIDQAQTRANDIVDEAPPAEAWVGAPGPKRSLSAPKGEKGKSSGAVPSVPRRKKED